MAVSSRLRFPAVGWKMDGQCNVGSGRVEWPGPFDCVVTSCSCLLSVSVGLVGWRPYLGMMYWCACP